MMGATVQHQRFGRSTLHSGGASPPKSVLRLPSGSEAAGCCIADLNSKSAADRRAKTHDLVVGFGC
jgi:hypothetical protein